MAHAQEFVKTAQTTDQTQCNYWRYCSSDGYLCSCCGGSYNECPPGSQASPTSWIGTCINPDDKTAYLIAYQDCCGKDFLRPVQLPRHRGRDADLPGRAQQRHHLVLRCAEHGLSLLERRGDRQGVSRRLLRAAVAVLLAASAAPATAAVADGDYRPGLPLERVTGAEADFTFHCRGCHGWGGEGTPGHVPRLDGFVGLFTQLPEGRDYLMRVPGAARSKLDDARLAAVLDWMLATYGRGEVPAGFARYTAEEVGAARHRPLGNRAAVRARLIAELRARGAIGPGEDGLGVPQAQGGG